MKAAGPLVLGGDRALPPFLERLALLLPAPLPAALVATSTFVHDQRWILDAGWPAWLSPRSPYGDGFRS